jgi:hypothetical protein
MRQFHFDIHNNGARLESLGSSSLNDDSEALAFGKQVIRDLMDGGARQYSGWTMDITESGRAVGSILFEADLGRDQEKCG